MFSGQNADALEKLTLVLPHVHGSSQLIQTLPTDAVCENTNVQISWTGHETDFGQCPEDVLCCLVHNFTLCAHS